MVNSAKLFRGLLHQEKMKGVRRVVLFSNTITICNGLKDMEAEVEERSLRPYFNFPTYTPLFRRTNLFFYATGNVSEPKSVRQAVIYSSIRTSVLASYGDENLRLCVPNSTLWGQLCWEKVYALQICRGCFHYDEFLHCR